MMFKPVVVKPLPDYKLWVEYTDGVKGEVDLSHLVGKGVFVLWNDPAVFQQVYIGAAGQVAWSDEIELCPDAIYLEISGKLPEEVFPNLSEVRVYA
jgi:hypothetical protein